MKIIIPTLGSIAILLGCDYLVQDPIQPTQQETQFSPIRETQTANPLNSQQADALIVAMIEAINEKNAQFFLPYLLERDKLLENVEAALKHYEAYFQGETITKFEQIKIEQLGKTSESIPIQRFCYRLYTSSGIAKDVEIYQDRTIRLVDPFLLYSIYANHLVEKYTNAVQSQNIEQLSLIVNVEVERFNQKDLKSALAKYNASLSLNTLNYRFTSLNSEQQHFTYTLFGEDGKEHNIQVVYGDGLVGIRDDFLTSKN
jgi:hypothetical protein